MIVTRHFRIEGQVLRQPVESETLQDVQPFRLVLRQHILKRFPGFIDRRITVVQRTSPLVFILIYGGLTLCVIMRMTVGEGEVCRVIGHGMTLSSHAHAPVTQ